MSIRKRLTLAVVLAGGLAGMTATPTSASIALRTDPGNAPLTGPTTITSTSGRAIYSTAFGQSTCNQTSFDLTVTRNTSPTSITGTLTQLSFICGGATPTCALNTGVLPTVHLSPNGDAGALVGIDDLTLRCPTSHLGSPTQCYYTAATVLGLATNLTSQLTFTNINLGYTTRSDSVQAACFSVVALTFTLTHLVQGGTNRTVTFTTL